jgi:hypothetical protein
LRPRAIQADAAPVAAPKSDLGFVTANKAPRLISMSVRGLDWAGRTRQVAVWGAGAALLGLGFLADGTPASELLAIGALFAIGIAACLGGAELSLAGRIPAPRSVTLSRHSRIEWIVAVGVVAIGAGLAIQSWFRPDALIATGDIPPPIGTAWLSRLFDPWVWGGSSLGEPSQLPLALPWAAVVGIVHWMGGDPVLSQRVWYTALYIAAGLGAFALFASLGMRPVAACIGAAVYLINPYVLSEVNINPVFMAAMCPLAAGPAALIAAGSNRLRLGVAAGLMALLAPILGYVFSNPPLLGLVLGVTIATPLLVAWTHGRRPAMRSLLALALAVPLIAAASTYWAVPSIQALGGFAGGHLASISSWDWTEIRSSVRNALWLNTTWAWHYPEYFPFAKTYEMPPLAVAKFVLPATAFAALAAGASYRSSRERFRGDRRMRVTVVLASVAIFILLLSTGTNAPGNVIFQPLYQLPYGWLLREPGRFLMLAALTYAGLVACVADEAFPARLRSVKMSDLANALPRAPLLAAAAVAILLTSFPIVTGQIVVDNRTTLPPSHVSVPAYWLQMASLVDGLKVQGNLVMLPPDDFYSMPYTWGYYGSDTFTVELFKRHVLVPNDTGYVANPQLTDAVNLMSETILQGRWRETEALARALNAPLVLVRRDIATPYPGRSIASPIGLSRALEGAPGFFLVDRIGALDLYQLRAPTQAIDIVPTFVTIDDPRPDLRLLSVLPTGAGLIAARSQPGIGSIVEAPPLDHWLAEGGKLVWREYGPPGWTYDIGELNTGTILSSPKATTSLGGYPFASVQRSASSTGSSVAVTITGRSAIANGDFGQGTWGPVGDCHAVSRDKPGPYLSATVLPHESPNGTAALQLSAVSDSACESRPLSWAGGPLVMRLMTRGVIGLPPRICLWESGPERCASLAAIPQHTDWATFTTTVVPDDGTKSLSLYLYADAAAPRTPTVTEYAEVTVLEVPSLPAFVLLGNPDVGAGPGPELLIQHSSFSKAWQSPAGQHVLVDGLMNGWVIPAGTNAGTPSYSPVGIIRAASWTSVGAALLALLLIVFSFPRVANAFRSPPGKLMGQPRRRSDELRSQELMSQSLGGSIVQASAGRVNGSEDTGHGHRAWLVSFGPVGAGSDGYLLRTESNARALANLGYMVDVLDISTEALSTRPFKDVVTHPAWSGIVRGRRILGPIDLLADLRGQLALAAGLLRHGAEMRAADVVVVEGGLMAPAFALAMFRRQRRPLFVFDLITLMSSLHRDTERGCSLSCKGRRLVWRVLEAACVNSADVVVAGSQQDARRLHGGRALVVPHVVLESGQATSTLAEDPDVIGFLGNGHVAPNREALAFIGSSVLKDERLRSTKCLVIGDADGYGPDWTDQMEFVGFFKDPSDALSRVSVCCAPMEGAGGVSTKVLAYLTSGKRTVCTPESAHGIAMPPKGLWVADRNSFASTVITALSTPWSPEDSQALRDWMIVHHGLPALSTAWLDALSIGSSNREGQGGDQADMS